MLVLQCVTQAQGGPDLAALVSVGIACPRPAPCSSFFPTPLPLVGFAALTYGLFGFQLQKKSLPIVWTVWLAYVRLEPILFDVKDIFYVLE